MGVPSNAEEYLARFEANCRIEGYGPEVCQILACPWCAAPDFQKLYPAGGIFLPDVPDIDEQMATENTCKECGRSGKALVQRTPTEVSFEFVQTGGPDAPEWLGLMPRRIDPEVDA